MLPENAVQVLLVEDDDIDAEAVSRFLSRSATHFVCVHETCLHDALISSEKKAFNIVLLDLGLPDSNGLDGVHKLREKAPHLPIVVLTGLDDQERASQAMRAGAQDYLVKGKFDQESLERSIRYAIQRQRVQTELNQNMREKMKIQAKLEALNTTLEERVETRTQELGEINQELEKFAYSVSHDLQAPLRSIDGFSEILIEDYGDRLDQTGKDYLSRVRAGATRMKKLIDDMLLFSRQTRGDLVKSTVSLTLVAQEIVEELKFQSPNRHVCIEVEDNLIVQADKGMMRVVLDNLLGNAWKFTQDVSSPHIVLGKEKEYPYRFYIQDNGAGFDMAHAGRIFEPFKRLHTEEEFPGTGIGLATVKRIIHRHGGRVSATGKIGEGATLYFSL